MLFFLPVRAVAFRKEEIYTFTNEIHLGLGRNFEPHPFAHAHFMADPHHVIIDKMWVVHREAYNLGKVNYSSTSYVDI